MTRNSPISKKIYRDHIRLYRIINDDAIAYLDRKLKEEATDDPEEIRKAEEELAEFKRNMNANREATGERLVFP